MRCDSLGSGNNLEITVVILIVLGMFIFIGVHLVPLNPGLRERLKNQFGPWGYRAIFSILSLAGLVLVVAGFRGAEFQPLWSPPGFGRPLAMVLMPFAFIFLVATYMPTNLRRLVKHPMLIGVSIWACVHLLANGDLASTIIFAGLLAYSLADIALARSRDSLVPRGQPRWLFDGIAVVLGIVLYAGAMHAHVRLSGVALIG